ncbi:intradiol ring-cleavage dioxygenase [Persicitalea sp.]|uniref:dioxygenase family protein n=1 Tax=Persicitalea sp. TaxID=3100273 RepID=UPI0035941D68
MKQVDTDIVSRVASHYAPAPPDAARRDKSRLYNSGWLWLGMFFLISCQSKSQQANQNRVAASPSALVGGGCDGCERMYLEMPAVIPSTDTSFGWTEARTKLVVTGTVYQNDGRTPAPDVIVYYWQTDEQGFYSNNQASGLANTRHGSRRGWMKTGADGKYTLHTNRPAAYPDRDIAAHIHLAIKEQDIADEYYVDELVFDDDPLLTTAKRKVLENRGGSGVMRPREEDGSLVAEHDIILGLHIPNYPENKTGKKETGLSIGEESPSFTPYHAWGPDRGSKACPVCKYGRNYGILYFVKNANRIDEVKEWLVFLEKLSREKMDQLKVYMIVEAGGDRAATIQRLERLGRELDIRRLALTVVPSFGDEASDVVLYGLAAADGRDARTTFNTFIVYKGRVVIDKYEDLKPMATDFEKLTRKLR